ncbi:hypothetical protein LPB142_14330 [Rhodobacter xanthinilyticus]|uniref:Uncharacterized protein n=1 Tax=Rhodobacter xanthinilyticus TaxID=1850250 RepID=A0A1D9MEQ7_9RHOB|nr:hypothetical protein [Rhodobacter xanthinilyticus]AOZ70354.1 hypothetical protein LPB142_14330 [Rhodobacter xanthinilyticus]
MSDHPKLESHWQVEGDALTNHYVLKEEILEEEFAAERYGVALIWNLLTATEPPPQALRGP